WLRIPIRIIESYSDVLVLKISHSFPNFFCFHCSVFYSTLKFFFFSKVLFFFFFFGIQFFFPVRYDQMMESESELICFFLFLAEGVGGVTLMWCQRSSTDQG
ncbi:hypothetical protein Drorol1_Dr00010585, partial [Drosera rotundifolia]